MGFCPSFYQIVSRLYCQRCCRSGMETPIWTARKSAAIMLVVPYHWDTRLFALTSVTIAAGATSNTMTVQTNQDDGDYDSDGSEDEDETFTVSLGTLPSPLTQGSPLRLSADHPSSTTTASPSCGWRPAARSSRASG